MLGNAPLGDLALGDQITSGAATLTASITESAAATDAESSTLSTSGADAESTSAGDSSSATLHLVSSAAENASATDSESSTAAMLASDVEAATAAETESGVLALGAAESEAGSATESEGATLSTSGTVTEAGSATDSESSTLAAVASVSEVASAGDMESSIAGLKAADSEAGTATEAESGVLSLAGADSESGTAGDSETGALHAIAADAEAALASSTQSSTITLHASESETATAGDAEDAVLIVFPRYDSAYFPDFVGQAYKRFRVFKTSKSSPKSAGDQALPMSGSNILWAFSVGWNVLTRSQAQAVMHALEFMGGSAGQYFFEWYLSAGVNVHLVGTPLGGVTQALILPALMYGGTAAAGGLTVAKNGVALSTSLWSYSETSYFNARDGIVTLAPAGNTLGATYTASWTAGRRRRSVRLYNDAYKLAERQGLTGMWTGQAALVETEAGT